MSRAPLSREQEFEDTVQPIGPSLRWPGRMWWPIRGHWLIALLFWPLNLAIAVVVTGLWLVVLGLAIVYRILAWIGWVLGNS